MTQAAEAPKKKEVVTPQPACKRSIQDIITDLSKPVAQKHLSSRKQGGTDIHYIAWHHAEQYLDWFAAGWNKEIKEVMNIAGKVAMTVRISIPCLEGVVVREATGYEEETKSGYGDPFSNAESMALRRCAANFGLGRYLYE